MKVWIVGVGDQAGWDIYGGYASFDRAVAVKTEVQGKLDVCPAYPDANEWLADRDGVGAKHDALVKAWREAIRDPKLHSYDLHFSAYVFEVDVE